MFARFVEYLCRELIEGKVIAEVDKDVYDFGIRALLIQSAHVLLVLLLGYAFGLLFESILFLVTYMPLRIYAGGYHASTHTRCFISSIFMMIVVFVLIRSIPASMALISTVCLVSSSVAVILRYAPVETANKPLDEMEQGIYRTRASWMLVLIITGILLCLGLKQLSFALTLSLSLFAESLLILVETRKQEGKQTEKQSFVGKEL